MDADTPRFSGVDDEMLIRKIIAMDVGRIKIPVRQQTHQNSSEKTGNKYFVLKDLKPGDKDRLPDNFDFLDARYGQLRMWLSYKGKKRRCYFCGKFHEENCPLEAEIRRLEHERDMAKRENGGQTHQNLF